MMAEEKRSQGMTTVAPDVILNIAKLTTLGIEGVSQMSTTTSMSEIFQRGNKGNGVRVLIKEKIVFIDLHVVLEQDTNVRQVSREIQEDVARAVKEMVGLEIGEIKIHIEDINYTSEIKA
jgi:uncharacterized alkaline shock family protein YloU